MGVRGDLSGYCVGQDGWVDEERGGGMCCYVKGGRWGFFLTRRDDIWDKRAVYANASH